MYLVGCACGTVKIQGNVQCLNGPIHSYLLPPSLSQSISLPVLHTCASAALQPPAVWDISSPGLLRHSLHMYIVLLMYSASSSSPCCLVLQVDSNRKQNTRKHAPSTPGGVICLWPPPKHFSSVLLILGKLWGRKWWNRIIESFTCMVYILWDFSNQLAVF